MTTTIKPQLEAAKAIIEAAEQLADDLDGMVDAELWRGFTCQEMESFRCLLVLCGHDATAEWLIKAHGLGDEDESDQHHYVYAKAPKCSARGAQGEVCTLLVGHDTFGHRFEPAEASESEER